MKNSFEKDESIDIKGIFLKNLRYWPLFFIFISLAYFLSRVYLYYTVPVYQTHCSLIIKEENSASALDELTLFSRVKKLGNEMAVIKSYDLVAKTISELDFEVSYFHKGKVRDIELYKNSPFKVVLDTGAQLYYKPIYIKFLTPETFRLKVGDANEIDETFFTGKVINKHGLNFSVLGNFHESFSPLNYQVYFIIHKPENLIQQYSSSLSIGRSKGDNSILELSLHGTLPKKQIDFLNKHCEVYIRSGLEEKNSIATNTIKFIDEQLDAVSSSLNNAEADLESFRKSHKVMDISSVGATLKQNLDRLEIEKGEQLLKAKYYEYIYEYLTSNKDLHDIVAPSAMGINDNLLTTLISDLLSLNKERTIVVKTTTLKNPYLKELDLKIEHTKASLQENLKNIINSSNIILADIESRMKKVEKSLALLPGSERTLVDIQRRFNLNDHIYNYLLEKRAEAGIARASNIPDSRILESAKEFNAIQVGPKSNLIKSVSLIIGFAIPLLLIFLKNFLNDKILSKEDVLKRTAIPIVGIIGHIKNKESNLVVLKKPKSSIAEAFRSIRINLQYFSSEKKSKVIIITSSVSGEGKTFSSINLSTIIAMSNKKTLLIGADLRKPKIFDDFKLKNDVGLTSYLSNNASVDEIIIKTEINNLDLILAGPVPPNPGELLASLRMDHLMEVLKERYDYIIMDSPPLGLVSDSFVLMKYSDINLYIVRHKKTEIKMLDKINDFYIDDKVKNVGIIINDLVSQDAKYGYGYEYGYGYGYGYHSGYYEDDVEKASFWGSFKSKIFSNG